MPAEIGDVTSSTLRFCLPAALSSDLAWSMSCLRCEARARRRVVAAVVVGGRHALAEERGLHRLLAIHGEADRLAHAHVVEGRRVDAHGDRVPGGGLGDDRLQVAVRLEDGHLGERHLVDRVHLTREQRVDARRVVRELDQHELVDRRLVAPVVRERHELGLLARLEADELPRAGADRLLRVVADRDDVDDVAQDLVEERRRALEDELDGAVVELLALLHVDRAELCGGRGARLGIEQAGDREEHVVGRDGLAVVELETLLEAHGPDVAGLVRNALVAQPVVQLEGAVEPHERLVEDLPAGGRRRPVDERGVEAVGRTAAADPDAQRAAGLDGRGLREARGEQVARAEQRGAAGAGE